MVVRSEPLSLTDLFEGLTSVLKPACNNRGLLIHATVDPAIPILQTDPAKLQQVLYNLLSNAIKFSPPDGTIELSARPAPGGDGLADGSADGSADRVRLAVTDRGPGIAADQHKVIFDKFRQLDGSVTRQHSGTGLGLGHQPGADGPARRHDRRRQRGRGRGHVLGRHPRPHRGQRAGRPRADDADVTRPCTAVASGFTSAIAGR